MTKRISPLESSREIYLARRISSNSETIGIYTFFEASSIGCCKMKCEVTKVTYNMYTCCVTKEVMEMDGRDNAKYRKSKLGDIDDIIEFVLNDNKTKTVIVSSSTFIKRSQNVRRRERGCSILFFFFVF